MTTEIEIVKNILICNSYCSTSEAILLAGIFDDREETQKKAYGIIKKNKRRCQEQET